MTLPALNASSRVPRFSFPEVDTPSLLVDLDCLARNLDRMSTIARDAGLNLRPHSKTHKSLDIARRQLAHGAIGITVAKPQEALVFWCNGVKPIFLAYPPVGAHKLRALEPIIRDGALIVGLDDVRTAVPIGELATQLGVSVPVLFEVDTGMHRVGVAWGERAAQAAMQVAQIPGLELLGVFCHEGHAHDIPTGEMPAFAAEIAQRMDTTAGLIRQHGHACPVVSVGSTLTARFMNREQGLTEIRPGTYVYNDVRTVVSGAADWQDCAVTVLATVVSRTESGRAVIDAGSKVFTTAEEPPYGFGAILDIPGAQLVRLNEEHGIMVLEDPTVDLEIGDRVRVIPIHVCVTINMQRELITVQNGEVVGTMRVDAGLCSR
jgi:D-serine deaminase-like pyridoxal phosphate-dependent protein